MDFNIVMVYPNLNWMLKLDWESTIYIEDIKTYQKIIKTYEVNVSMWKSIFLKKCSFKYYRVNVAKLHISLERI